MPSADRLVFAFMLENALLEKKEQAFEDFFVLAATAMWGEDFEPWRPQGRLGDMKCDGYRISDKTVFQCHAPETFDASKVAAKIRRDFAGACEHFGNRMEKWVFVHNHKDGLPAGAAMLVLELRDSHPHISIKAWTPNDLIQQVRRLPESKLEHLFPTLFRGQNFSETTLEMMEEFIKEWRGAHAIDVEAPRQLNRWGLDNALDNLDQVDREVRRRVMGYSRWYDPADKITVFEKLAMFGHKQVVVENNAQRLCDAGLIQITENHYLPLNEKVCQQAAESLMDEFLHELEE